MEVTTDIIKGCIKGNRIAQNALYRKYSGKMFAICRRYLKDEFLAEEAFQDGFIKVFNNIKYFQSKSSIETWMTRIFINESINKIRSNKSIALFVEISDNQKELNKPEETVCDRLDYETILVVFDQMPNLYRSVLMMSVIDGYSHSEIGVKLGITDNNSRSILNRARQMLKKLYLQQDKKSVALSMVIN